VISSGTGLRTRPESAQRKLRPEGGSRRPSGPAGRVPAGGDRSFFASGEPGQGPLTSAMTKLKAVLPGRLHSAVQSLLAHSSRLELGQMIGRDPPLEVKASILAVLGQACRQRRRVTAQQPDAVRSVGEVVLEPVHLVQTMGRWYLLAYAVAAWEWRVLRVDRLSAVRLTGQPSTHPWPSGADPQAYVAEHVRGWIQTVTGTVRVHAPAHTVASWIAPAWGRVIEETEATCIVESGADSYDAIAGWLLLLGADLTVLGPDGLHDAFRRLADRARRAASSDPQVP